MSAAPWRLPAGGRIDREHVLRFTVDGRDHFGFAGDTLASALLANGVTLVGRSFKYHRPRGFISAGVEEPNGLFTLGGHGRTTPNMPGTIVDLVDGLTARRQNGWPSVDFDLRAAYGLLASLLGAGFYYKTFMGPLRGSWMWYEPFIRRAAGLGRAVHERDPDRYEQRHAHADVLVVGAGPAGLAAALAAAATGARVVLVEQDSLAGGGLLASVVGSAPDRWREQMRACLAAHPNAELMLRTTACGIYDGNTTVLLSRHDHLDPDPSKGEPREVVTVLRAKAIVYATGAIERPVVFANNDRPGIMLASAVQSFLNRHAVLPGARVLVATNNDSAWPAALDLAAAGVRVTLADERAAVASEIGDRAQRAGVELRMGFRLVRASGGRRVAGAVIAALGGGREQRVDCDAIAMSGGWSPTVHLTSHGGIRPVYDARCDAFMPGGMAEGHFAAGAVLGPAAGEAAIRQGEEAGARAAAHAGCAGAPRAGPSSPDPRLLGEWSAGGTAHAISAAHPPRGKCFVDFQTDVTVDDIGTARQEGYESVEHLKRYTTLGMGTDQGKTSNVNAIRFMAGLRGVEMGEAGTTSFRPPYSPVSIGALAGRATGAHFRATRRSPLHDWHAAHGAAFTPAGAWQRAWYYDWAGRNVGEAYIAEMRHVRRAVGIADVSTLGKIDVQGPDAGEFLNRVYVNGFAKLPVGKARYGVMLNDEASVLDDGTTTRLSPTCYFMTTTTAQAAEVMSWLEFLLQTAWTGLKVQLASLTDEWGAMSVAGPRSRAVLERALPGHDLTDAALPHMGCLELEWRGVPLRLLRLSFSGELCYEVYAPANHAIAVWEHLLASGAPLDIRPYGLEALASLRIEKGHVAGLELDHRTTLDDLGLARMASKEKAYVGRELRARPILQSDQRWSLVGIECLEPGRRLRGGSILFAAGEPIAGHGRGYITSVTWSPELDRYIALGLYKGGLRHEGAEIVCAFPLKGEQVRARIVSPVFIDRDGARLHG